MSYSGGCAGLHDHTLSHMSFGRSERRAALQGLPRPPNLGPVIIRNEDYSTLAYSLRQESSVLGHEMKHVPYSSTRGQCAWASTGGVHLAGIVINQSMPMILSHR